MLKGVRLVLTALITLFNGGIVYLLVLSITNNAWWSLFWTVLVIAGIFMLARSKYGEWYLRMIYRMRAPVGDEESILNKAWREVCQKAGVSPDDYDLFLLPAAQDNLNAVAVGRRTIAVTPGMLTVPQEELEAVLAHELAHLLNKDSEYLLFISVVNAVGTAAVWVMTSLLVFYGFMTSLFSGLSGDKEGEQLAKGIGIFFVLFGWFLKLCAWLCTKVLQIAYLGLGRQEEYRCDNFAVQLGFGPGLANFLHRIWPLEAEKEVGMTAMLFASHPPTSERIRRVMEAVKNMKAGVALENL